MRLTAQMKSYLGMVSDRVFNFNDEAYSNFPISFCRIHQQYGHEMQIYKVDLENMYSSTDKITEKIKIIKALICVEHVLSDGQSEDYYSYIQMALHIAPNNANFYFKYVKI